MTKLGAIYYPVTDKEGKKVPFDNLYIPYIYREIYFEGVYTDILNSKKDMVMLDIGANIGIITDHFRSHCKKIYAIEPSTIHFTALKKNKEFNHWDNVEIFNTAMADKNGEMMLNLNDNNQTCHSLVLKSDKGEMVKTIRFDTFMEENNIDTVDFCKSDVEGAEDMIYRSEGFRKVAPRIKSIMMEMHFPNWMELVEYMSSLGFTPKRYASSAIIILFTRND